jgi:hypothetical protein
MPSIIGNMPNDKSKKDSLNKLVAPYKEKAKKILQQPGISQKEFEKKVRQGSQDGHHVTTVSPKKNSMTKSERDFEAGQKLKAEMLKKFGVYKNTAN